MSVPIDTPGYLTAFGAGILSFLSPCVLPLVPGYLAALTGLTRTSELSRHRTTVLRMSLMFIVGFSLVFISMGASASKLGVILAGQRRVLTTLSAIVVIVMGFALLRLFPVKAVWRTPLAAKLNFQFAASGRFASVNAALLGATFAFGWTPCVGPILSSILALAANAGSLRSGITLLGVYSLGLGLAFLMVGLAYGRLTGALQWFATHGNLVSRIAGVFLLVIGFALLTNNMGVMSSFVARMLELLGLGIPG